MKKDHFRLLVLLFSFATTSLALSQALTFEVASIKPNTSGSRSSSTRNLPVGAFFTGTNVTLRQLILISYRLRGLQLSGGPAWVDSDRFDVDARAAENVPADQIRAMVRALLADRFKLVVHNETREQPIYALVPARPDGRLGPKIKASSLDCTSPTTPSPQPASNPCGTTSNVSNEGGVMTGGGRSMADLATALASFVTDRMVIDRTGLSGAYDFELRWTPDNLQSPNAANTSDAPSIFSALQEQLGLKLEAQRGPVEFLLIDSVAKPTPN